jgi:hypothetical protein
VRGSNGRSGTLFSYVDLEALVPGSHRHRWIRAIVELLCRIFRVANFKAHNPNPSRISAFA